MNQQLIKMAEAAAEYALLNQSGEALVSEAEGCDEIRVSREFIEKFAELIVAECMELASAEQKRYANISHRNMSECAVALGNFSLLIKDHFEDEE